MRSGRGIGRSGLLALAILLAAGGGAASAEWCRQPARGTRQVDERTARCKPEDKLRPHDPDRLRAGRQPGFIDLGGGTEVRVGGRVRLDYDVRR